MQPQPSLNIATKKFIGIYKTGLNSEPIYSYRIYVKSKENNTVI
jgi:hypothetical protein